jgi:hypothetical protein
MWCKQCASLAGIDERGERGKDKGMTATTKRHNAWNSPLMYAGLAMYAGLLMLFGWQTWQFVSWLFPDDQLLAKILTMLSFDILAAFWAIVHTFYRFADRGAKTWVVIAWALTFILSLLASVLYLVIQFYFRFSLAVSPAMVDIGYAVSILALVFNILALMAWLILEHQKRHPRQDEFELYEEDEASSLPQTRVQSAPPPALPSPDMMAAFAAFMQQRQAAPAREVTGEIKAVPGATADPLAGRRPVTMSQEGTVEAPGANGKRP